MRLAADLIGVGPCQRGAALTATGNVITDAEGDGGAEPDDEERGRECACRNHRGEPQHRTNADRNQKGMELFAKQFKPHRQLLVGEGGMRWQDFLKMDISKLFA